MDSRPFFRRTSSSSLTRGRFLKAAPQEPQPEAQPRPVNPIILTADKPAEKLKEITDRLEQGITELFDSERYKEYLQVMSKFHNYSFNNTLLIAMQKPDASLIAGFSAWKNNFGRNVMRGEKGIPAGKSLDMWAGSLTGDVWKPTQQITACRFSLMKSRIRRYGRN